jgi:hypothetical protein
LKVTGLSARKGPTQYGVIAEEVAKVAPDLVFHKNGDVQTVRFDQIGMMLLNEFLKEHKKVEELEATIGQQQNSFQSKLVEQEKKIEALTSGLQKVSAQLEVNKTARQIVLNNQ